MAGTIRTKSGRRMTIKSWVAGNRAKKAARGLTQRQKATVKRLINANLEHKYVSTYSNALYNGSANTVANEMWPVIPKIGVGDASFQRQGQKIKPKSLTLDVVVSMSAVDTSGSSIPPIASGDLMVNFWLLKSRRMKDTEDIRALPSPINFLDDGQGGTMPFYGNVTDLDVRVNTEEWQQLAKRQFRLSKASGGLNGDTQFGYSAGNPTVKKFRLKVPLPANFQYTDETDPVYPTNFAPVWTIGFAYPDGTPFEGRNYRLNVTTRSHLDYTDA